MHDASKDPRLSWRWNVAKCEKAEDNGKAVPLAEYWKIITAEAEEQRAQKRDGEETSEIPGTSLS